MYSFTFKTHYCYNKDGSRFHGHCSGYLHHEDPSGLKKNTFQPQEFSCHIVQLEKQYQHPHFYNDPGVGVFILPPVLQLPLIIAAADKQAVPVFACRGGPPLPTLSLRGPPLV